MKLKAFFAVLKTLCFRFKKYKKYIGHNLQHQNNKLNTFNSEIQINSRRPYQLTLDEFIALTMKTLLISRSHLIAQMFL